MKSTRQELLLAIKKTIISIDKNGKVILYGSQARGTANQNSDWDVLILLDKPKIEPEDFDRIVYPLVELGWNEGEQISPKLYTFDEWKKRNFTPFYKNIEKEGVVL
jgi:predicted nucleotidyltransferase